MQVAKSVSSTNHSQANPASSNPNHAFPRVAQDNAATKPAVVRPRSSSPPDAKGIAAAPGDEGSSLLSLVPKRRFHFNDSHMHPTDYRQNGLDLPDYIKHMDTLEIGYTTLMPLPTSLNSRGEQAELVETIGRCGCEPNYYLAADLLSKKKLLPEDIDKAAEMAEMFVDTDVDYKTAINYSKLSPEDRKRFDPMITGLHIGNMDCSNRLLEKLNLNRDVFTGVGEITVHKEVVDQLLRLRWANLTDNVNPLLQLLFTCGEIGMPVVLHCDVGVCTAALEDEPAYLAGIKKLFSHEHVRKATIIWAHAGGIGRFVDVPNSHVDVLHTLLGDRENYPKLHIDLSWTVVAEKIVEDDVQLEAWAQLINKFPDRFIFGSDSLVPNTPEKWNSTYIKYKRLIDKFDKDTVDAVFTGNYERVFVGARSKVRAYEKTKLAEDIKKLNPYYNAPGPVVATRPAYADSVMTPASSTSSSTSSTSSIIVNTEELELQYS